MSVISAAKQVNAVPILTLVASISVGLGNGIFWLAGLAVAVIIATVRAPRIVGFAFLRTLPVTGIIVFFAAYSVLVTRGVETTASVLNLVCWAPLIVFLVAQYQRFGPEYFVRGLKQLSYVLAAIACWGIVEGLIKYNPLVLVYPNILGAWRMGTPSYRASAIFGHPIPFAHMMIIGMSLAVILHRRLLSKIVMCGLFLGALVTTQTRSVWPILAALLLLGLIQAFRLGQARALLRKALKMWPLIVVGLGVLAACIWFTPFGRGALERLAKIGPQDVSLTQRTASIEVVLHAVFNESSPLEMIFGHGFASSNAFILSQTLVLEGISTTDNYFLALLYDFGIAGLVLFMAVAVYAVVAWWKVSREPKGLRPTLALSAGYITLSGFLFMNFYAFTIWRGVQFVMILAFSVLVLLSRDKHEEKHATSGQAPQDQNSAV